MAAAEVVSWRERPLQPIEASARGTKTNERASRLAARESFMVSNRACSLWIVVGLVLCLDTIHTFTSKDRKAQRSQSLEPVARPGPGTSGVGFFYIEKIRDEATRRDRDGLKRFVCGKVKIEKIR